MVVSVRPIGEGDVAEVAAFLHQHLDPGVPVAAWAALMNPCWDAAPPNRGFLLRCDGSVVGAYLGLYSEREVAGRSVRMCNLTSWCVAQEHRSQSIRLLQALLRQPDYQFTDLSPSENVVPINRRTGFVDLDTTARLVLNLPLAWRPGVELVTDPSRIEALLTGESLRLYRDHVGAAAARHTVLRIGDRHCWVVHRRERLEGLPPLATVLHVSDPEVFRRASPVFLAHLLVRHRLLFTLVEERVAPAPLALAKRLSRNRHRMYRSADLSPDQIDYFYSELMCLPW